MEIIARPDYLIRLLQEVEAMDEQCFQPNEEVGEGETIIDDLQPYERKLYATAQLAGRTVEEIVLQAKYSLESREDHDNHKLMDMTNDKRELLFKLLWAIITNRIQHYCGQSLGIRRDWHLVVFPRKRFDIRSIRELFE